MTVTTLHLPLLQFFACALCLSHVAALLKSNSIGRTNKNIEYQQFP